MTQVEIKGTDKLIKDLDRLPRSMSHLLKKAFEKTLITYRAKHKTAKMKGPPPPLWRGRSPVAPGVHATRAHGGHVGFLSMFHVTSGGDRLSNMWGKLATKGGMIAYHQEVGRNYAEGRIPLPPAKDRLGRTTAKARKMWREREKSWIKRGSNMLGLGRTGTRAGPGRLIMILIRGKKFWFARDPKYRKERRTYKKYSTFYTKPNSRKDRLIPMFHESPHRIKPRLSFYGMWRAYYPKAAAILLQAIRHVVSQANRGAA